MEGLAPGSYSVEHVKRALDRLISGERVLNANDGDQLVAVIEDEVAQTRRSMFFVIEGAEG